MDTSVVLHRSFYCICLQVGERKMKTLLYFPIWLILKLVLIIIDLADRALDKVYYTISDLEDHISFHFEERKAKKEGYIVVRSTKPY